MSVGEDLKRYLEADASIKAVVDTRIAQGHLPDGEDLPYIWYMRRGTDQSRTVDGTGDQTFTHLIDMECVSEDIDQALDLAELVRARLDMTRGSFGNGSVKGIFVQDQSDDYIPRNLPSDEGVYIPSLEVSVMGYSVT